MLLICRRVETLIVYEVRIVVNFTLLNIFSQELGLTALHLVAENDDIDVILLLLKRNPSHLHAIDKVVFILLLLIE